MGGNRNKGIPRLINYNRHENIWSTNVISLFFMEFILILGSYQPINTVCIFNHYILFVHTMIDTT